MQGVMHVWVQMCDALRIDNRRQGPFWWGRAILGTSICLLRSDTFITYLFLPYFMAVLLI